LVGDPEKYRTIDQGHSLPKHRQNGLPRDEARQALLSHYTRLGNMDTSRLSDEEKTCIHVRQANLKTGVGLYAKMQAGALGLPAEFA
ncbi:MAG: hypothetical protein LBV49_10035, partial [Azonexus sp.]|nr:hypothetical protein [Azonexus sp.]